MLYSAAPRVTSTSSIPSHKHSEPTIQVTSPPSTSMTSASVFRQYAEQHRAYAEHTRQAHEQERELWNLERTHLSERIKELEQAVMQLGGNVEDPLRSAELHSGISRPNLSSNTRTTNGANNGNEFWKGAGGIGATQPTRAFSEPSSTSHPTIIRPHHLPSIHENGLESKKSVGFDMTHTGSIEKDFHVHPIPIIPFSSDGASFDSITFKPAVLSGAGPSHRSSGTQSPSPLHTPQHPPGPREPKIQLLHLPRSGLTSSQLLVKDAGHTPLARLTDSAATSGKDTPKHEESQPKGEERPMRPPTERSDSYFPASDIAVESPPIKDDPALREPLALTTHPGAPENNEFLSALDLKLREAQMPEIESEPSEVSEAQHTTAPLQSGGERSSDGELLESEEPEPALRIRSSMNFGTAFGAQTVGKDL